MVFPAPSLLTVTVNFQNSKGQKAVKRPRRSGKSHSCLKAHEEAVDVCNCAP